MYLSLGGNAVLDYEAKPVLSVKVRATDQAGNTADQTIRITVSNLDEQADSFTFAAIADAPIGNAFTSNTVTISGLAQGVSVPVAVTGGMLSKNGTAVGSQAVKVVNGDRLAVTVNSADGFDTITRASVKVGSGKEASAANFNVVTLADPLSAQWTPNLTPPPVQAFGNPASTAIFANVRFEAGIGVVIVNLTEFGTAPTPAVTIGGTPATVISSGNDPLSICYLPNVTAGLHDVVVSVSGGFFRDAGIATGTLTNAKLPPAGQQFAGGLQHPPTLGSVAVPANGIALVAFGSSVGNATPVWSPVEPDLVAQFFDPDTGVQDFLLTTAHLRNSATVSVNIAPSNNAPDKFYNNAFVAVFLESLR
jgi:hypothetical protein